MAELLVDCVENNVCADNDAIPKGILHFSLTSYDINQLNGNPCDNLMLERKPSLTRVPPHKNRKSLKHIPKSIIRVAISYLMNDDFAIIFYTVNLFNVPHAMATMPMLSWNWKRCRFVDMHSNDCYLYNLYCVMHICIEEMNQYQQEKQSLQQNRLQKLLMAVNAFDMPRFVCIDIRIAALWFPILSEQQ